MFLDGALEQFCDIFAAVRDHFPYRHHKQSTDLVQVGRTEVVLKRSLYLALLFSTERTTS